MKLVIFAIIIILCFYILCYFTYPKEIMIIQSDLENFDINNLLSKQPIIIDTKILHSNDIIISWFSILNIIRDVNIIENQIFKNKYKYLIIHPENDVNIFLNSPTQKVTDLLEIQLKEKQLLIIPYHWKILIENTKEIKFVGIHDCISYFVDP
jgi:hypothetical protein